MNRTLNVVLLSTALVGCNMPDRGARVQLPDGPHPINAGETSLDSETVDQINRTVRSHLEAFEVPGMGLALIRDGEVVYTAGYGWADLADEETVSPQTPFLLASVSKTFIGVTAMQVRDDGLLAFDDPIADLVGFSVDNPRVEGETITLRHLLTHNSGIEDSKIYDRSYAPGDPETELGVFLEGYLTEGGEYWHRKNYAKRPPLDGFAYSNIGASLAAYAIEVTDGQLYRDVVDARVFAPLGMENSAFFLADLDAEPATAYGSTILGRGWKAYTPYGFLSYPDGLVRSSAEDMGQYVAAIAANDGALMAPESLDEMLTVDASLGTDEDGQAIVWAQREMGGRTLFGHNGGDFGSTTEIWIDRQAGVGIAVMMNADFINEDAWLSMFDMESELLDIIDK
ncbi:MAG: serine hydrolase domain-containing protein [Myxococcota bacterium]